MFHNKLRFRSLVLCGLVAASMAATCAWAGHITPGLATAYSAVGDDAKLPVLISLTRQTSLEAARAQLGPASTVDASILHSALIDAMQSTSSQSRQEVATSIEILTRNGMAENVDYLWIANLVKASVNRAGAELIANFEAVDEIGLDVEVSSFQTMNAQPSEPKLLSSEASLQSMRAREIWAAGVTGAGTIVAVLGQPFHTGSAALDKRMIGAEALLASTLCGEATSVALGAAVGCDKQKGDTIGVAPDAQWRLLPLICGQKHVLSDVLVLMQQSLIGDYEKVPDVILHVWKMSDSCNAGIPAQTWNAFVNAEQLGCISVWPAGDDGAGGRGSVALPGGLPSNGQTFFSVGATHEDARTAASYGGKGPSPCDFKSIKPDLTAVSVGRSVGERGFVSTEGTLLAAGYVAGTLALMRQVNPAITAVEAKNALKLSANDAGVAGEDNDFGYGVLNINAAVELAASSSESGSISGTVRYGGEPIGDARVYLVGASGSYTVPTNQQGTFRFSQIPAERKYALYVARFGYKDFTAPDSVATSKQRDFSVGVELDRGIADDAEVDRGFMLGVADDNATAGVWTRAAPVASTENGYSVQVGEDATAYGSFCFVTGNGGTVSEPAAANDVDGGKTTLRSPQFRLDNLADSKLRFKYAYSNDRGQQKGGDFFRVQISNDGGDTWTNLIQTSVSTDGWQEATFSIADFVEPTAQMKIQFVAEDNAPPSLVEAAVDEIFIEGRPDAPEPPKNLSLTPTETGVELTWNKSVGASSYKLYLSGEAGHVFAPENLFTTLRDTFLFVPYDQIPYEQFYFQVTAVK